MIKFDSEKNIGDFLAFCEKNNLPDPTDFQKCSIVNLYECATMVHPIIFRNDWIDRIKKGDAGFCKVMSADFMSSLEALYQSGRWCESMSAINSAILENSGYDLLTVYSCYRSMLFGYGADGKALIRTGVWALQYAEKNNISVRF